MTYWLLLYTVTQEYVKPAGRVGGGGEAGHGVGIWHFSKICHQIPCRPVNHSSQMQPNFPIPGCTLLSNIPRQNPRKAQWKHLQIKLCNLYLQTLLHHQRYTFLLQLQLYVLTIVRVTPLSGESPHFVGLNIPFLAKGTKKVSFTSFIQWL